MSYDEKHANIRRELVNILGEPYVEDDPGVMEAFYRCALTPSFASTARAEFIVLPESADEVSKIMRLANMLDFPVSTTSTGMYQGSCNAVAGYPHWCVVDPKRMNHIEIDGDNMYAVVEPYVTVAQVQAEAMRYGLFHGVTGASCQASVMGTNVFQSIHWTSWRSGIGRNLLGVEWVLPSGEILRLGSLSVPSAGWFWGEGPGPDLRGVLRGNVGHLGSLGIVTKIAVKLHPWPGPTVWPTKGIQPEKVSELPRNTFKSFFISFPTLKQSVDAIAEMGRAEIAGWVMKFCPWDFVCWYTRSFEEFWAEWHSEFWTKQKAEGFLVAVGLWAFAGPRQLDYEEKVLRQVVREFGGTLVPKDIEAKLDACLTPNAIRDTHRNRFTRFGRTAVLGNTLDSLYDTIRSSRLDLNVRDRNTPPLGEMGIDVKFWPADFGHAASTEIDGLAEKSPDYEDWFLHRSIPDQLRIVTETGSVPSLSLGMLNSLGAMYDDAHLTFASIKSALDPNNIANPTRVLDMKALAAQEESQ